MSLQSDEALMLAYGAGNAEAFDTLYQRHRGPLYRYVRRQAPSVADELFQDIWLRVVRSRETYESTAKFTTFLYTIARRRLIDHFRSQGRQGLTLVYDESEDDNGDAVSVAAPSRMEPEHRVANHQTVDRLLEAIEHLPPEQRDAFLLQEGDNTRNGILRTLRQNGAPYKSGARDTRMSRRDILTPQQRLDFSAPAPDERTMVRYYTLNSDDLALINQRSGDHNRLNVRKIPFRVLSPICV